MNRKNVFHLPPNRNFRNFRPNGKRPGSLESLGGVGWDELQFHKWHLIITAQSCCLFSIKFWCKVDILCRDNFLQFGFILRCNISYLLTVAVNHYAMHNVCVTERQIFAAGWDNFNCTAWSVTPDIEMSHIFLWFDWYLCTTTTDACKRHFQLSWLFQLERYNSQGWTVIFWREFGVFFYKIFFPTPDFF